MEDLTGKAGLIIVHLARWVALAVQEVEAKFPQDGVGAVAVPTGPPAIPVLPQRRGEVANADSVQIVFTQLGENGG